MECAEAGNVYTLISKNSPRTVEFKKLGEKSIQFIAGCVIFAIEYLHEHKIMYRDLKP